MELVIAKFSFCENHKKTTYRLLFSKVEQLTYLKLLDLEVSRFPSAKLREGLWARLYNGGHSRLTNNLSKIDQINHKKKKLGKETSFGLNRRKKEAILPSFCHNSTQSHYAFSPARKMKN